MSVICNIHIRNLSTYYIDYHILLVDKALMREKRIWLAQGILRAKLNKHCPDFY